MEAPKRRRSKGCDQCRRRRVKCDETGDFCRQCLRFGYACTGLLQGIIVVDMTSEASQSSSHQSQNPGNPRKKKATTQPEKKKRAVLVERTRGNQISIQNCNTPSALAATLETEACQANSSFRQDVILYQPSTSEVYDQNLLAQFVTHEKPRSLLGFPKDAFSTLPDLVAHTKLPALKFVVRAVATAFHATLNGGDVATIAEACKWYIASLNSHRKFLSQTYLKENGVIARNKEKHMPDAEEMNIPLLLCFFELITSVTTTGLFQHRVAACKVLEIRGPGNCQTGIFHQVFKNLRASEAMISIFGGQVSRFADPKWRILPFLEEPKPPSHRLIDVILCIAPAFSILGPPGLLHTMIQKIPNVPSSHDELRKQFLDFLQDLESWWRGMEVESMGIRVKEEPEEISPTEALTTRLEWGERQFSPAFFIFRDAATALNVATYHGISIIVHTTLNTLPPHSTLNMPPTTSSPSSPPKKHQPELQLPTSTHTQRILAHSASIIHILSTTSTVLSPTTSNESPTKPQTEEQDAPQLGYDIMFSAFALRSVQIFSSSPTQRRRAEDIMMGWGLDLAWDSVGEVPMG